MVYNSFALEPAAKYGLMKTSCL